MLLSATGFPSSKTVQIRIYNFTTTTEVVAWTSIGVSERADGEVYSTYYYNYSLTSGSEYIVDWKDNSTPVNTASEAISLLQSEVASIFAKLPTNYIMGSSDVDNHDTTIDTIAINVAGLDGAAMRGTDSAALASVCTETRLAELDAANLITDVANVKTDTAAILLDTAEIGTAGAGLTNINLPDQTMNITGNITGNISGSIGSLATQAKADVNAEVADVINTDANVELASVPTTTSDLRKMIQFIFQYFRNKRTATDSVETLFKEDASTSLGTATLASDGTTRTKGEMG